MAQPQVKWHNASMEQTSPTPRKKLDRLVPLQGTDNFRDLGGYETAEGRKVKWGLLYRSGHLGNLTDGDLEQMRQLGISKVTDFRGSIEKDGDPNRLPPGVEYTERPVDVAGADLQDNVKALIKGKKDAMSPTDYLTGVNKLFVREYTPVFKAWLYELIHHPGAVPQVYHCTAGKDRTGFASALFLHILGVPLETIMNDYMLSVSYMADSIESILNKIARRAPFPGVKKRIRPLLGVEESYLQAAFDTIEKDWGSFDAFVGGALELSSDDIAVLKNRFLD